MGKLGSCQSIARDGDAKEQRDISEISSLTANSKPSPQGRAHTIMKLKNLRKKIRRLEKRLQEGPKKLAKLRAKLQAAADVKAMKAARKSAARAASARRRPSTPTEKKPPAQITGAEKPSASKKAKRKLHLSPERRAQLAAAMKARWAAMKARWAAKRAAEASATTASADDQHSAPESIPQTPESRPNGV